MGSPLGVLFANFFVGMVEREVFRIINKPAIYARYIDDIFVKVAKEEDLIPLREKLQAVSGINFTIESSADGKFPFLDVLVAQNQTYFNTSVYTKPTNPGLCLSGKSEYPQRFKDSTISAYIRRALKHCSSWKSANLEIERATYVLVNNDYSNQDISKANQQMVRPSSSSP
ncbi:uncharacterized protein LOC143039085 [Oratosquilla oratoria]|uniref:uncharacterized protein LOC143039085 n=1 Tax=Oratosquilla oratoria TaxID=337810 RepID=UPI003F76CF83